MLLQNVESQQRPTQDPDARPAPQLGGCPLGAAADLLAAGAGSMGREIYAHTLKIDFQTRAMGGPRPMRHFSMPHLYRFEFTRH